MSAKNFTPRLNEFYWTITADGQIVKTINRGTKSDLFNLIHSLCFDSGNIDEQTVDDALILMDDIINTNIIKKRCN